MFLTSMFLSPWIQWKTYPWVRIKKKLCRGPAPPATAVPMLPPGHARAARARGLVLRKAGADWDSEGLLMATATTARNPGGMELAAKEEGRSQAAPVGAEAAHTLGGLGPQHMGTHSSTPSRGYTWPHTCNHPRPASSSQQPPVSTFPSQISPTSAQHLLPHTPNVTSVPIRRARAWQHTPGAPPEEPQETNTAVGGTGALGCRRQRGACGQRVGESRAERKHRPGLLGYFQKSPTA